MNIRLLNEKDLCSFRKRQKILQLSFALFLVLFSPFFLEVVYAQFQLPQSQLTSKPLSGLIEESEKLLDEGREEEALTLLDGVPDNDPNYSDASLLKARALESLSRYEEAVAAYDEATRIDPDRSFAWALKGNSLYILGRYEEAVAAYDEATRVYPGYVYAWHNKAFALEKQGKYYEAITARYMYMSLNSSYWTEQIIIALLIGIGAWFLGTIKKINHHLARFFFYIQRIPLTHFVSTLRTFDNGKYFLTGSPIRVSVRNQLITLGSMAIGSVGLILEASCSLTGCTSGTQAPDPGSEFINISLLFYSWALTIPLFAFFILPVQVMDASNVRLVIKEKNIVTNPTVPYRVIIKGFGAILVIYGLVTAVGSGQGSAIETLFTIFLSFYPLYQFSYFTH